MQRYISVGRGCFGVVAQFAVVGAGHPGEAFAERVVVGPDQRIEAGHSHQTEVVIEQHDVTDAIGRVNAAGRVGEDDRFNAKKVHDADRERHLLGGIALVEMSAAALQQHRHIVEHPDHQGAAMAGHGGLRPTGDFGVGNGDRALHLVGQRAQARAEHNAHTHRKTGVLANDGRGLLIVSARCHGGVGSWFRSAMAAIIPPRWLVLAGKSKQPFTRFTSLKNARIFGRPTHFRGRRPYTGKQE